MHEVLVNRLGGLSLPRKSVVRLTDRPDMTLDVYRGRKTIMQQQQQIITYFMLRSLDTEANKFYDRTNRLYDAALLTRCHTQYALRPVIDSKINHIRHFIKIPFINKGMDFIDLPSIFRDKSVQSSIPNYFKNYEVPIICYKYNKPIRGAIFNFNKLVSDLDIETCNPDFCDCKDSKNVYPAAGHVITGNLRIISDSRIRSIIAKGPKYRFPVIVGVSESMLRVML